MRTEDIILRDVITPADPQAIRTITESTCFFYPDEVDITVGLAGEHVRKGFSRYNFLFADTPQGRTVGYACYGLIPCTRQSFDIYWLAVHKDSQGAGIGKKLIAAVEKSILALGGKTIYLDTASRPLYEPTRQFYLRCHFRAEAQLKDFYDTGDDKIIFVKRY
jgi:D-alanine-D-alanine ligase